MEVSWGSGIISLPPPPSKTMATSNIMAILPFVLMFTYFVAATVVNLFRILKRDESTIQGGPCDVERNNRKRDNDHRLISCRL
jgi:hypothetical protein